MRIPKDPVKAERARLMAYKHNMKNKLMKRYGITPEQYDEMLSKQDSLCAICRSFERSNTKRRLSVDHCHETGKVRGLLCHRCNIYISNFNHSPELLERAANYLRGAN